MAVQSYTGHMQTVYTINPITYSLNVITFFRLVAGVAIKLLSYDKGGCSSWHARLVSKTDNKNTSIWGQKGTCDNITTYNLETPE